MQVRLSRAAEADLDEIRTWVQDHNPEAARRLLETLTRKLRMLGDRPHLGRLRDDIAPGIRVHVAGRYLVLYRITATALSVVRVVDGRRDLQQLFTDPAG